MGKKGDVKIRKIKDSEIPKVLKLYKESYSEFPYNEKWENKILLKKIKDMLSFMKCFVALTEDKIVGVIFFYLYDWDTGKKCYIEDLAVDRKFRRKGIAKKLIKNTEDFLIKNNIKTITLTVNKKANAFKLYKELNFVKSEYIKLIKELENKK